MKPVKRKFKKRILKRSRHNFIAFGTSARDRGLVPYPVDGSGEAPRYINIKKIVVSSEYDKDQLLKAFKYFHDSNADNDYIVVNHLMHLYMIPELIEIDDKSEAIL